MPSQGHTDAHTTHKNDTIKQPDTVHLKHVSAGFVISDHHITQLRVGPGCLACVVCATGCLYIFLLVVVTG